MKQIVISKTSGARFETTTFLSAADVARLTHDNPSRDAWKRTVMQGQAITMSDYHIELLGRYLRPVAEQAPQAQATPRDWRDEPATDAQMRYLVQLNVRFDDGITKGRASQLIDAARGGYLGSVGGFYTDGSN